MAIVARWLGIVVTEVSVGLGPTRRRRSTGDTRASQRQEVNRHLNRAKVNVLWSRREGFNRAIIEAMFAGVPCILRQGINYGHHYDYINPSTGRFSTEKDLPRNLSEMIESYSSYALRDWVMKNMSCQRGTEILNECIREGPRTGRGLDSRSCRQDQRIERHALLGPGQQDSFRGRL